ncbi:hypothetical protein GCM10009564_35610 [Streptomyces thermogriseus]|uniref:Uncharacterized protein n=1 Tax=Streptomyces thermogriseus TaxID=75292 RepID=A0ABP4DJA7_9ACTN
MGSAESLARRVRAISQGPAGGVGPSAGPVTWARHGAAPPRIPAARAPRPPAPSALPGLLPHPPLLVYRLSRWLVSHHG